MDRLGQLIKEALAALFQTIQFPRRWDNTKTTEERREETKWTREKKN